MDTLLGVPEIMNRYGCCRQTASKRMKQMKHLENPLLVPEWAVTQWEREQMEPKRKKPTGRLITREEAKGHFIPRRKAQEKAPAAGTARAEDRNMTRRKG